MNTGIEQENFQIALGSRVTLANSGNVVFDLFADGFGPKKVIMVVGINKIVPDVNEGFLRIKREVAPKNCVRLGIDSPCAKLGHCISLEKSDSPNITDGCAIAGRICCSYIVNAHQRIKDRITVILCGEPLGY